MNLLNKILNKSIQYLYKLFIYILNNFDNIIYHKRINNQITEIQLPNKFNLKYYPKKPIVFIAVKNVNWEKSGLVDSWNDIADVIHYDWGEKYDQYAADWHANGKKEFNEELIKNVNKQNAIKKIDIFFSYLSGRWVFPETIDNIRNLGIITINYGFDDTLSFRGTKGKTGYSGNIEIAKHFDLCVTSQNPIDIHKYIKVGGNSIFLPSGGNQNVFSSIKQADKKDIPVSFIGQNYGQRPKYINYLFHNGIDVYTRGLGWKNGPVSQKEMLEIYSRSLITLGFGFISDLLIVGLKGRDFEVPMTGCAYLTTYNEYLAKYFKENEEIIFYKSKEEMLKKIKYFLSHPEDAISIGIAGKTRALKEHKWVDRWKQLLIILGYLEK